MTRICFIILISVFSYSGAFGYNYLSVVKSYDKTDYSAGRQNWDIDIDSYGVVYFGNTEGLLRNIYGIWELSQTASKDVIRSLKVQNDTIWCGGDVDFGYFVKATPTDLEYTFIGNVEGGTVWDVECLDNRIFFQTEGLIMVYDKKAAKQSVIRSGTGFYSMTLWNNQLWAISREGKIGTVEEDTFKVHYNFNQTHGVEIRKIFVRNNQLYFILFNGKMFAYDGKQVRQVSLPESIDGISFFTASSYDNEIYSIGTISNGLLQIDEQDNSVVTEVNSTNNLIDNTVLAIKKAPNGNIWLGLDYGIAYVELKNALKPIFNKGATYYIQDYNNTTYLATNKGLFSSEAYNPFTIVPNSEGQVWRIREIDHQLYICHTLGLMKMDNNKLVKVYAGDGVMDIARFGSTDFYLLSTYSGVILTRKSGDKMQLVTFVNHTAGTKLYFDDSDNCIWSDTESEPVTQLRLVQDDMVKQTVYDTIETFFDYNNNVIFYNGDKLLSYSNGSFDEITPPPFNSISGPGISAFYEEANGNSLAYVQNGQLDMLVDLHDGTYYSYKKLLSSVENALMKHNIFIDIKNGELRIGTDRGVTTFNIENTSKRVTGSPPVITKIEVGQDENDFKEYTYPYMTRQLLFSAGDKNIIFHFGTQKSSTDVIEFRYILWPYDNDWSQWSATAGKKEYTKLNGGTYRFTVQSRLNGKITKESEVSFVIDSYWYQTKWVIIPYSIIFLLCILFTIHIMNRLNKKRILNQQQQHEQDVVKSNIAIKNEQLLQYAEIISHKNQFLMELKEGLEKMRNSDSKRWENKILEEVSNEKRNFFFHKLFSELHQDFINRLTEKHTNLTPHDVRILSFIRINLDTQEIANLMNISPKSVDVTRYRLRKKMGLSHETDLNLYIREL
ncbi:helix-turn-helix transcriptional regulator [Saccharicrinis sp. FJH54]|uniref:helix-turn-helix and ligand-binding sensor domain-containing protein n=1 Tax=Saccharicrinis sp. FJH54 TaxID=3344665 RepID=UPI0035D3FB39